MFEAIWYSRKNQYFICNLSLYLIFSNIFCTLIIAVMFFKYCSSAQHLKRIITAWYGLLIDIARYIGVDSWCVKEHVVIANWSFRWMRRVVKRVFFPIFLGLVSMANLALSCGFHDSPYGFSIPTYDLECIKNGGSYDNCYVTTGSNKTKNEKFPLQRNPATYNSFFASRLRSNQVDTAACDVDSDCSKGEICSWKMGYFGICD